MRSICTLSLLLVMTISGCIGNQPVTDTHTPEAPGGANTVNEQSDIHRTDLVDVARVTPTRQEAPGTQSSETTPTPELPGGASTFEVPTPTTQAATGKFTGWVVLEDPGYGFRFAVPCFWQVDFPKEYLSHQAYSIRNYTYEYVLSFPNQAEEIWKRGGIKIDLVTPPRSPQGVSISDYVAGLHNEEAESRLVSTEEVLINDQGALLVTTESIFGIGQYYVFELTEDAFLLFSPSPGALGNPDVQGILHSIAIHPDARVVMPDFPPGYPLEGTITGCRDANELEVLMTGPKSIAWGSGVPVKIHFALRNLTDRRLFVLDWFTPFEGVAGDIFQVTRDGVPVPYHGVLAPRAGPSPDSFLQIEPKGAIFAEVNLFEAYDFSRPGRYEIAFKSPPSSYVAHSDKNLSITLDELGPVYIPSGELIIEVVIQE